MEPGKSFKFRYTVTEAWVEAEATYKGRDGCTSSTWLPAIPAAR